MSPFKTSVQIADTAENNSNHKVVNSTGSKSHCIPKTVPADMSSKAKVTAPSILPTRMPITPLPLWRPNEVIKAAIEDFRHQAIKVLYGKCLSKTSHIPHALDDSIMSLHQTVIKAYNSETVSNIIMATEVSEVQASSTIQIQNLTTISENSHSKFPNENHSRTPFFMKNSGYFEAIAEILCTGQLPTIFKKIPISDVIVPVEETALSNEVTSINLVGSSDTPVDSSVVKSSESHYIPAARVRNFINQLLCKDAAANARLKLDASKKEFELALPLSIVTNDAMDSNLNPCDDIAAGMTSGNHTMNIHFKFSVDGNKLIFTQLWKLILLIQSRLRLRLSAIITHCQQMELAQVIISKY